MNVLIKIYFNILKAIAFVYNGVCRGVRRMTVNVYQRGMFKKCGKNVTIGRHGSFIYKNIEVGDNVAIGPYASFLASVAKIHIGNNVMFGPHVTIRGGDHRIDMVGRTMFSITEKEKLPENDKDVYIEDDVWIGCNVTILKGVRIGRGSVVGAGSVVAKDVPPYTIHVGVHPPYEAKRFTDEEIKEHERILYYGE